MTLRVELVVPDGPVWSGQARMVVAKTLDGDMGILTGHPPVLGLLAEGSLVRILGPEDGEGEGADVVAAVSSGFLSVAGDRVSVLARHAELGPSVDTAAAKARLDAAQAEPSGHDTPEAKYAHALLRAAGDAV